MSIPKENFFDFFERCGMDIVDRIEVLCRNSATNITALEKELGLGHGRIMTKYFDALFTKTRPKT